MDSEIIQYNEPVTLVGGGEVDAATIDMARRIAPSLVAADGGANVLIGLDLMPDRLIGDLDSVLPQVRGRIPAECVVEVSEQETTDFEKCLERIAAPFILAAGFTGARVDHALAVWNALVRHPAQVCIVISGTDVALVLPPRIALDLAAGTRVSLFPIGPVAVASTGLRWPTAGIAFRPDGAIGTSNAATGPVTLSADRPVMLLILPRECLAALIAALTDPQSPADRWPGQSLGPAASDVRGG